MNEFKEILLGNMNIAEFGASMFFACLTAIAMIFFRVKRRDPASERTPENFDWSFFWSDNFRRQIGTLILIFLSIRISQYKITSVWAVPVAIVIGLISDQLAMLALAAKDKATQYFKKRIDNVDQNIKKVDDKVEAIKDTVDEINNKTDK